MNMQSDGQVRAGGSARARRRRRRAAGAVAGLVMVAVLVLIPAAGLSPGPAAAARSAAGGTAAVGALFTATAGRPARHFCTASVVHSSGGDLLITAAHCLTGRSLTPAGSIVFAPGWRAGAFPFGVWAVTAEYVDDRWSTARDPNDDVAFLRVSGPGGDTLEARTGAEALAVGRRAPLPVRVIGYPDISGRAVHCRAAARPFDRGPLRQLVFSCAGYTDGTSGGPFLALPGPRAGAGLVVGVIGGYQQGGDTPGVSYSPQFGRRILALYDAAARD